MPRRPLAVLAALSVLVIGVTWWIDDKDDGGSGQEVAAPADGTDVEVGDDDEGTTTTTTEPPYEGWSNPAKSGDPYPESTVEGLLTFRGNPTRSYYGVGPVPAQPTIQYRFPAEGGMCGVSTNLGETKTWCGMGWTGQPTIAEHDGRTWAIFGAYDGALHFMDADTGERILPDFPTGDLIKGTPTIDPDGFPLVYSGSRDNYTRVIAIDGTEPVELFRFHADDVSPVLWNDDWDSSPLVIDDYMFQGGENSQFVVFKLNRGYDATGKVTVAPQLVWNTPSWDDELLAGIGDETVSVEVSPTIVENTLYFANSGGLVQGWDLSGLPDGVAPTRTFRFWTGDDTDTSIVSDDEGFLYVAVEYERSISSERSQEVGQLVKLDPKNAANPIVWSVKDTGVRPGGMWATPAIHDDIVYAATNGGRLLGVDRTTGVVLWEKSLPGPLWGSPVVVDDVLLQGDCDGIFHGFGVSDPRVDPPALWSIDLGGCIEATPAVWKGRILIGSRNGFLYSLTEPAAATTTSSSQPDPTPGP